MWRSNLSVALPFDGVTDHTFQNHKRHGPDYILLCGDIAPLHQQHRIAANNDLLTGESIRLINISPFVDGY